MNKHNEPEERPLLETLACVSERSELCGGKGQNNLTVRKVYGRDDMRYLRCQCCGAEFSERKNTALWNTKVSEARAVSVAEHLGEGCSLKATARLAPKFAMPMAPARSFIRCSTNSARPNPTLPLSSGAMEPPVV